MEDPLLHSLLIDRSSSLPAWIQIKEQIKFAFSVGVLNEGDVLPSIRARSRRIGVGDAVVRRAYRELTELGFLSAEPRKHLMVTDTLSKPEHVERWARKSAEHCDRLIDWARSEGFSSISYAVSPLSPRSTPRTMRQGADRRQRIHHFEGPSSWICTVREQRP